MAHWELFGFTLSRSTAINCLSTAGLRAAMKHARTNELIALHCAPHWCYTFHVRLRALLVSMPARNSPHVATREAIDRLLGGDSVRAAVVADVDEVLSIMRKPSVKQFLLTHSILPDKKKSETDYL